MKLKLIVVVINISIMSVCAVAVDNNTFTENAEVLLTEAKQMVLAHRNGGIGTQRLRIYASRLKTLCSSVESEDLIRAYNVLEEAWKILCPVYKTLNLHEKRHAGFYTFSAAQHLLDSMQKQEDN